MRTTEKKYWQNGYQVRGGWHKTLALSFVRYGVMFSWGTFPKRNGFPEQKSKTRVELYKLI